VPDEDIERRYGRSLLNLRELYIPLAATWFVYNSATDTPLQRIAWGTVGRVEGIDDAESWRMICGSARS